WIFSSLCFWFNKSSGTKSQQRVIGLLEDVRQATCLGFGSPANNRLFLAINAKLKRYQLTPQLVAFYYQDHWSWMRRWVVPRYRKIGFEMEVPGPSTSITMTISEVDAVLDILSLAEEGILDRVRRCKQCQAWDFVKFSHQLFCGTKCQQKFYRSSPEWKE